MAELKTLIAANKPRSFRAFECIRYKDKKADAVVILLIKIGVVSSLITFSTDKFLR